MAADSPVDAGLDVSRVGGPESRGCSQAVKPIDAVPVERWFWIAVIAVLVLTYFGYAVRGSFYLDDEYLLLEYGRDFAPWWDYHMHFGRIITRYLYWTYLPRLFGEHPEFYFLFNLVFVVFGAWSFGRLLAAFSEIDSIVLPAMALYLLAPTTFHGFSWIATFQHIGAYPFMFVFIWKMIDLSKHWNSKDAAIALVSFVVAMLSNQLAVVAPAIAFILTLPRLWGNSRFLAFAVVLGIVSVAIVLAIKSSNVRVTYYQEFSWRIASRNLGWYVERFGFGRSMPKYLAIFVVLLVAASRAWRSTLFLPAAVIAILPFLFLVFRQNTYFLHLTFVLAMACMLHAANALRWKVARAAAFAVIALLVGYISFYMHHETYKHPLGSAARESAEIDYRFVALMRDGSEAAVS